MTTTEQPAIDPGPEAGERLALESGQPEVAAEEPHAAHSPGQYVFIAVVLGVLTAIEVWLSYVDISHTAQTVLLIGLMVLKFALVVMYFMHLRFDKPVFRRLFVTGLVLAVSVFIIVLLAEHADLNHSSESPPETEQPAAPAGGE
jgi:cytochrome c oxidase subunit IV